MTRRSLGFLPCVAMAIALPAAAQEAQYPRFDIRYLAESVLEPTVVHEPGSTVTIKDDEALFVANYGHAFVGKIVSGGSIEYLGKRANFAAGEILVPARVTGGDLSRSDSLAPTLCLDTQFDGSRGITTLFTLGIADATATFDRYTTFCAMDKDQDGKLETGLLAGVRDPALRKQFPIDPIAYVEVPNYVRDGNSINLRYHVGTMFSKPRLTMLVGDSISSPVFRYKANNADGKWTEFKNEINFSPKNLPYTFDFLTMRYTLVSMSKQDKTATFRVDRGFSPTPICRDC